MKTHTEIITTTERSGPFVARLRILSKLYAAEGRGVLDVRMGMDNDKAHVCSGDRVLESFDTRHEAAAHLRAGGFCQVDKAYWRPRYDGAPYMAKLGAA